MDPSCRHHSLPDPKSQLNWTFEVVLLFSYQLALPNFVGVVLLLNRKSFYILSQSLLFVKNFFLFLFNQDFQVKKFFLSIETAKLCVSNFCIISHIWNLSRIFSNYFLRNSFVFLSKLFFSCATESIISQLPFTVKHFLYFFHTIFFVQIMTIYPWYFRSSLLMHPTWCCASVSFIISFIILFLLIFFCEIFLPWFPIGRRRYQSVFA